MVTDAGYRIYAGRGLDLEKKLNLRAGADAVDETPHGKFQGRDAEMKKVVHLSTNVGKPCAVCLDMMPSGDLDFALNHYLQHKWEILHIGQETQNVDGNLWHNTVSVVAEPAVERKDVTLCAKFP